MDQIPLKKIKVRVFFKLHSFTFLNVSSDNTARTLYFQKYNAPRSLLACKNEIRIFIEKNDKEPHLNEKIRYYFERLFICRYYRKSF